jgi:hypothetical protein
MKFCSGAQEIFVNSSSIRRDGFSFQVRASWPWEPNVPLQPSMRVCVISHRHLMEEMQMRRAWMILATVAAVGATAVTAPAPAEARGLGPGLAFGLAAGALTAGAIAGAYGPYYGYGPGYGYYGYPAYGYGPGPYAYYGGPYYRHRYYRNY